MTAEKIRFQVWWRRIPFSSGRSQDSRWHRIPGELTKRQYLSIYRMLNITNNYVKVQTKFRPVDSKGAKTND